MSAKEGKVLVAGDFSTMRRIVRFLPIEIGRGNLGETGCCRINASACGIKLLPGLAPDEKPVRVLAKAV